MTCLWPLDVSHPHTGLLSQVACGRCSPCRIRRKQAWAGRLRLERQMHQHARFLTLTYSEDPGILDLGHLRDFLKRYRYHYGKCRFFAVGEYGEKNHRGHWHLIIFGHPAEVRGHWKNNLAWEAGFSYDGQVSLQSINYVAGYTLKGSDDTQHQPICRQSLKPGIGFSRIAQMAVAAVPEQIKVWPHCYFIDGKTYPLCQGGLAKFQVEYLEHGGKPPYNASQIGRDLRTRGSWLDWGTRVRQKEDSFNKHYRENVDAFASQKFTKKLAS